MDRIPTNRPKRRSRPMGGVVLGSLFLGAAYYGQYLAGEPLSAGDQFYLGTFKLTGALGVLDGLSGLYKNWLLRKKRKDAEVPSDTFGTAAFASLNECAAAGLLDPAGLYLGVMNCQPLFYSGKAHLLTCAPARQGKGVSVVLPNLLHYQGSVVVTDPKGELAAVTAEHGHVPLAVEIVRAA